MSSAINTFTITNPNLNLSSFVSKRGSLVCRFVPYTSGVLTLSSGYPRGLISRFNSPNRSVFSLSASHEDSKPSDIEIEEEASKVEDEESEEAWKQTLASFKEQALKMLDISQEAYQVYLKKAIVVLKETSQQLKIQADKVTVVIFAEITD